MLRERGCRRVFAKLLAPNDNSKNQVYFGGGFHALNLIPYGEAKSTRSSRGTVFKAPVDFWWLTPEGDVCKAPGTQLILYPQYPEVRLSGFLCGCWAAPSSIMASRDEGRILVLGTCDDGRVIGWAGLGDSPVGRALAERRSLGYLRASGVFEEVPADPLVGEGILEVELLEELGRIHRLGWIAAKRLCADGTVVPCHGRNAGGNTLEAELGVASNSVVGPDFLGYEVKQHRVSNFSRPSSGGPITLMTPEPTGGVYREQGVELFVRAYGYPDKSGRPDRLNFGGVHRVGERAPATGLTLTLLGWDSNRGLIVDAEAGIALLDDTQAVAAIWHYSAMIGHWGKKHDRAVYVPSMKHPDDPPRYRYGDLVRMGEGADFLRVLKAFDAGAVYYDPGIKLEGASTRPRVKRRSQFRVRSEGVSQLYSSMRTVGVL
jgi:hypothetical protein